MSSPNTITVTNIASATSDKEVQDFFSFCGKITDIKVTAEEASKSAVVVFEKDTAAKTALLLNNTQLGPNHISVTGTAEPEEPSRDAAATTTESAATTAPSAEAVSISQEEKPRARIFAEYLAHGYVIGDAALERAIDLDHRHNVTTRFASTLHNLDAKYHAVDRAKTADQSYGISQRANSLFSGLSSYFEKASNTPNGKRVVDFYTTTHRQAKDIHEEARRLADIKKQEFGGSAYKASGLNKVFGEPKPTATGTAAEATPAAAPAATEATPAADTTAPAAAAAAATSEKPTSA